MRMIIPPLRYSIPGVLLCVGIMLGTISTIFEIQTVFRRLEDIMTRHAGFIGSQTSGLATFLLEQNDVEGLTRQISQLGADQSLQVALILDDRGQILFSSRFEYRRKNFNETPWKDAAGYLSDSTGKRTWLVKDRSKLIGVFPFNLPAASDELVSAQQGFVFLEYDLSVPKELTIYNLVGRTVFVLVALAFFCVLAWAVFHKVITQRIDRLVQATKQLGAGQQYQSAALSGSDELASLSLAFDKMAAEITRRTEELHRANDRMKREIEDRKTAEEALSRSEILFRSVWESSGSGMRLTDAQGSINAVNPAYCELVGSTEDDLLKQPFTNSYQETPGALEQLDKYRHQFAQGLVEPRVEERVTFRSGRSAHLWVNNSYIQLPSGETFLLSIFRDVTDRVRAFNELKQAKEFSEDLIKTANVLIIGITPAGTIQIFNQTAEKLSGFSRAEVIGKSLFETLIPELSFPEAPLLFLSPRDGTALRSFEHVIVSKCGKKRVISWQTNHLAPEAGHLGMICFGIDITERKRQEQERLEFERKLLDTQKLESLGIMAGGIAHDFNNLLTTILGNASMAAMQLEPGMSAVKNHLVHVENASMRAAELCKQMLAYSGRGRLLTESIDLNEMIHGLTGLLDISISKKVSLNLRLTRPLPLVEGDVSQFQQVIMNLIINASEAIGDQPGTIDVDTDLLEASAEFLAETYLASDLAPGRYVRLRVRDTGCGMSAETRTRIFDPFFTTKFTGRGLGLAAVLGIIRGHHGALKVESEPGKGTVFTILVPASMVERSTVQKSSKEEPPVRGGDGLVIVADDETHIVELVAKALATKGFVVVKAFDGQAAVEAFQEHKERVAAVLLDLTMPVMSGIEAFNVMKATCPDVPVIFMSGYTEDEIKARCDWHQPDRFLQKPFDVPALHRMMNSIILETTRSTRLAKCRGNPPTADIGL